MFEDLDFSKLKLPIEPQNLVYIYLAYKLINNLDRVNLNSFTPKPLPKPNMNYNNFLFLVLIIIGSSFVFLNNILNRISFSSISVENLSAQDSHHRKKRLPESLNKKCPMRVCPLFVDCENMKEQLSKCLSKKTESSQVETKSSENTSE